MSLFGMRRAIAVQVAQQQTQFGFAVQVEVLEGAAQVRLDRLRREPQFAGDLAIGPAAGRQSSDLALARRQPGESGFGLPAMGLLLQAATQKVAGQALRGFTARPRQILQALCQIIADVQRNADGGESRLPPG
jgi:hypothetical protein